MTRIDVSAQSVSLQVGAFVLEVDDMILKRLEVDGQRITGVVTRIVFEINWEEGHPAKATIDLLPGRKMA